MNKQIRIFIRILLAIILVSSLLLVKKAFAQEDAKVLSHQYNVIFAVFLRGKIHKFHKDAPVVLYLKDGSEVVGTYKGYSNYDDSIWVKENGHWFQTGYGLMELLDIRVSMKEPV